LIAEPTSPATASYLCAATTTGSNWSTTHGNNIATYSGSTWSYVAPTAGLVVKVTDEGKYYVYNGSAWVLAKAACFANEAGAATEEIEAYNVASNDRCTSSNLPDGLNYGIVLAGQSISETDGDATVTISDSRIVAGDICFASTNAQAGTVAILKAVCTTGTLTVTLAGNGGAGTVINYMIVRVLA
jgi:hypothetical protein